MFKKVFTSEKTRYIGQSQAGGLIICRDNQLVLLGPDFEPVLATPQSLNSRFYKVEDYFVFHNGDFTNNIYNPQLTLVNSISLDNCYPLGKAASVEHVIFAYKSEKSTIRSYNVLTGQLNWEQDGKANIGFLQHQQQIYYGLNGSSDLICRDIITGELKWQINIPSLYAPGMKDWAGRKSDGKVSTLFTAYDDKLMMGIDSGHLLELDSATGNVLRECYPSYSLPLAQSEAAIHGLFSVNNLALSDDKTRLFNVDIAWLAEIDLTDFSLKQALRMSQLDTAVLEITGFMQQGRNFYFAATHHKTFGARALGVMDAATYELLWYEDVAIIGSEFFMKGDAPKIAGNLLWIQDTVGTLHMYERS